MARRKQLPAEVQHGTSNAYTNYLCRCSECRAANAVRMRKWRDMKRDRR